MKEQPSADFRPKIAYLAISALKPYPSNARTHSKKQIRQIADSIRTFGFVNPVLINDHNQIIAGHGRVKAAELENIAEVPTICISHLNEAEIRALIIADNRLAELAGWDKNILAVELQNLSSLDLNLDLTITGFDMPEINMMIEGISITQKPEKEDEIPAIPETPAITCVGDLWLLDKHRIFCGNSLESASFLQLMAGIKAAMVFTDPPYNVAINGNVGGHGAIQHREFAMAVGEMSRSEFTAFLKTSCSLLVANCIDGAIHFVCMDWRHMQELLEAGEVYDELKNLCVWTKDNAGMGTFYRSQHELIFAFKQGKAAHKNNFQLGQYGRYRSNVWPYPGINSFARETEEGNLLAMHPTVKPVALVADAIRDCSGIGDIILDSFLGSGTTLIAAERTDRICYGLELDPRYVDTAIRRWQAITGNDAVHAVSSQTFAQKEATHG
jgi:DNA modification methylase